MRWLGTERVPKMAELTAAGPVLVHFFDYAQLNSIRALPYVVAWHERYSPQGLATLGVHTPRFAFTAERAGLEPALGRLGVEHPVADDSRYGIWHDYGCRGWPSLFLWGQGGALRWYHFGEGEYAATEAAIAELVAELDPAFVAPEPLAPLRPSDAADALVAPPSEELFPGGSATEPWRATPGDDEVAVSYEAGGAHASVAGRGELRVAIDGEEPATIEVGAPGLYDLAVHERHDAHELRLGADPGIELYSLSFSAAQP